MQRNFFEHKQLRKQLIDTFSEAQEDLLVTDEDKFDYLRYLLFKIGKSYYISPDTELSDISEALKIWFETEHKLEVEQQEIIDLQILNLTPKKGIAKFLGISKPTSLVLYKNKTYFSYLFMSPEWFTEPKIDAKNEKTSIFSNLFVDNIEKFIFDFLMKSYSDKKILEYVSGENYFVENLTPNFQQLILAERAENEVLLAWLNIAGIKKSGTDIELHKKLTWYYLLTNIDSLLIGFDKNGEIIDAIDLLNRPLKLKKGIRNSVIVDEYEWTPSLTNSSLYSLLEDVVTLDASSKTRKIASLNVKNSKSDFKFYSYAKFILSLIDDITVPLTIFLLEYIQNKEEAEKQYLDNDKLIEILTDLLNNAESEEQLTFWFNDWKPNIEQGVFIAKMLISASQNNEHLKKVLPFHKLVHQLATENEKDEIDKILLDIEYSRHLISLEKFEEAEGIISKDLKKLPDQNISDLLPSETVDPTGHLSGQFLKVILLELLAETQNTEDAEVLTKQVAELQPLAIDRIYKLTSVSNETLKNKASVVLGIIKEGGLSPINEHKSVKVKMLDKKDIELLKHQTLRKKGALNSFSKWVSSTKMPDFSTIKQYAEDFSPAKHSQIADIISDLLILFGFNSIQVYIAHGELSVGIKAYEDDISFLVIGGEHLNPDSDYYLTFNELKFVIASELAYLYFKFARITSSDVWRGAMEKGNIVVSTLIDIIPFAGSIGAVAKNAAKVKVLSDFLEKNEQISRFLVKSTKIADITNKSEGIISIASQLTNSINMSILKEDNDKNDQLIAISRMMQITADRVGLLYNNDPVSAVRAVFLTSKEFSSQLPAVQKYGLNSFLLKKDIEGHFLNQNFAVRFASMFSFWLSDDFDTLYKKIISE